LLLVVVVLVVVISVQGVVVLEHYAQTGIVNLKVEVSHQLMQKQLALEPLIQSFSVLLVLKPLVHMVVMAEQLLSMI
tara:strand:+ start:95 stop:325 length:231 start_codon:yes stop_codon:yes gene_type:complete